MTGSQFSLIARFIIFGGAIALVWFVTRAVLSSLFVKPKALEQKILDAQKEARALRAETEAIARRRALLKNAVGAGIVAAFVCAGFFAILGRRFFSEVDENLISTGEEESSTDSGSATVGSDPDKSKKRYDSAVGAGRTPYSVPPPLKF